MAKSIAEDDRQALADAEIAAAVVAGSSHDPYHSLVYDITGQEVARVAFSQCHGGSGSCTTAKYTEFVIIY